MKYSSDLLSKPKKKAIFFLYDKSEIYSFGRIIKTYGFYPKSLPNPMLTDHSGPNFADFLYWDEQADYKVDFLTHTKDKAEHYSHTQKGNGYAMYPPYLWYYQKNKAKFAKLKKTYITFIPIHSLPDSSVQAYIEKKNKISKDYDLAPPDTRFDFKKLVVEIKSLMNQGESVRICLHFHDVKKGVDKYFIENGIEVVTAGNSLDDKFVDRFFDILFTSKYLVSNHIGTAFLYATLFKVEFQLMNSIAVTSFEGKYDRLIHKKMTEDRVTNLSPEIIGIVDRFFEKKKALTRLQTSALLYRNLFRIVHLRMIIRGIVRVLTNSKARVAGELVDD